MDATFTRRRLVSPQRLRELMQRSDLRGALQLGSHFAAIAATGALLWTSWGSVWAVPAFLVHGVLLNFLYAGQHELSHATVFATKWPNELFGRIIGFLMLYPRDFDKIQHWAHHQHTQDWEKDGELVRAFACGDEGVVWNRGRLTAEERDTAREAVKVLGLNVAGVDLLQTKEGPKVLEVNSSPGLEGIEKATEKDIAGLVIEHVESQVRPLSRDREGTGRTGRRVNVS